MATNTITNTRWALHACACLALLWAGCGNLGDDKDLALNLGSGADGGPPAEKPGAPPLLGTASGSGASKPSNPGTTTMPGAMAPPTGTAGGTAGCKMHEDEKQVCVLCVDGKGNVVRDGCYPKQPKPADADCHDIKRTDGALCTVCFDAKGTVSNPVCRVPDANGCMQPTTPGPVTCKEYEDKGQLCMICHDSSGKEVKRDCASSTPPGGGVTCSESKDSSGTVCTTCIDQKGNVVKKGCSTPMTPADPAGIKCAETDIDGQRCTICWDAQGKEIKRGCWQTMGGTPPNPQDPKDPQDPTCKEYRSDDGATCFICVDAKGAVVKQDCAMPASPPPTGTKG